MEGKKQAEDLKRHLEEEHQLLKIPKAKTSSEDYWDLESIHDQEHRGPEAPDHSH